MSYGEVVLVSRHLVELILPTAAFRFFCFYLHKPYAIVLTVITAQVFHRNNKTWSRYLFLQATRAAKYILFID
jgi:hypothetical protein